MKMKFFNLARELSKSSTHRQHKIGAVLIYKNRIISKGFNQLKTNPKSPHEFRSTHAEFDAIMKCSNKGLLKGSVLYVFRQTRDGVNAMSRPCKFCFEYIKRMGIKEIYYTNNVSFESEKL